MHRFLEPFVRSSSEITALESDTVIELIETTLSPQTKDDIMTTYAQFIQKGVLQGKIEMLYKSWRKGFTMQLMIELSDLPEATLKLWFGRFEILQKCRLEQKSTAETAKQVQLTEQEVKNWWAFFEKTEQPK